MESYDSFGFIDNVGEAAVSSITLELVAGDVPKERRELWWNNGSTSCCDIVITRRDGSVRRERGVYWGMAVEDEKTNGLVASDPNGYVDFDDPSIGGYSYNGKIERGNMSGRATITRKMYATGSRPGDRCLSRKKTFSGDVQDGLCHGYGVLTSNEGNNLITTEEGEFFGGNRLRVLLERSENFEETKESTRGLWSVDVYDKTGMCVSTVILPEKPVRSGKQIPSLRSGNLADLRPLVSTEWKYGADYSPDLFQDPKNFDPKNSDPRNPERISCYLYDGDERKTLQRIIEIDCNAFNEAFSKNLEYHLPSTGEMEFLVDRPVADGIAKLKCFRDYQAQLVKFLQQYFNARLSGGTRTFLNGGNREATVALVFACVEDMGELRRFRFSSKMVNQFISVTCFLESMGIEGGTALNALGEDYITTTLSLKTHSTALILDLKKMKEIVKTFGWHWLNSTNDILFYLYDSSGIFGSQHHDGKYKNILGGIRKNTRRINRENIQNGGSCWFHGAAAVVAAIKNPHLVDWLRSGKIELYGLSNDVSGEEEIKGITSPGEVGEDLNIFLAETMLTLQRIGDMVGYRFFLTQFLARYVVNDDFVAQMLKYFDNGRIGKLLEQKIEMGLALFESGDKKFPESERQSIINRYREKFREKAILIDRQWEMPGNYENIEIIKGYIPRTFSSFPHDRPLDMREYIFYDSFGDSSDFEKDVELMQSLEKLEELERRFFHVKKCVEWGPKFEKLEERFVHIDKSIKSGLKPVFRAQKGRDAVCPYEAIGRDGKVKNDKTTSLSQGGERTGQEGSGAGDGHPGDSGGQGLRPSGAAGGTIDGPKVANAPSGGDRQNPKIPPTLGEEENLEQLDSATQEFDGNFKISGESKLEEI
ncbi:MAG: hypothetical protein LBU15_01680 [Rickettsiales bacterium]|jgi:hypothetical protein|nr:hypothetical protein [Rickettsiales bacterium]